VVGRSGFDGHVRFRLISEWDRSVIETATRAVYPRMCGIRPSYVRRLVHQTAASKSMSTERKPLAMTHNSLTSSTHKPRTAFDRRTDWQDYFDGDIDDVFVYRRAVSGEEARAWKGKGRNSSQALPADQQRGLTGYWNFEGMGGEEFQDRSGNGHHGVPDLKNYGHSRLWGHDPTRVARFRTNGGIECGQAGDFDRTDAYSAGGWFCWEGGAATLFAKTHDSGPNRGYFRALQRRTIYCLSLPITGTDRRIRSAIGKHPAAPGVGGM